MKRAQSLFPKALLTAAVALLFLGGCSRHHNKTHNDAERASLAPIALEETARPRLARRLLEPLVGSWTTVSRFRPNSSAPLEMAEGHVDTRWILGQLFLEEEVISSPTVSANPYRGLGIMGYNPASDSYRSVWIDNRRQDTLVSTGTVDSSGRVFTFKGKYTDPISGSEILTRQVITLVGEDTRTLDLFEQPRRGDEFKVLEVTYTRRNL